jgi:iron complex transport system ATP-binding protein
VSNLRARAISAGYQARDVLRGVDLDAGAGELVALVGPNGAGKSTLLRVLAGLLHPSSGHVSIDGHDVFSLDRAAVARRVAVVPQVFETLFPFTVREVVALGRTSRLGTLGRLGREDAVLAMALAQEADVLLLDEPTAHLDPAHQRATLEHVARLARERALTVIAVLHDLNLASALATRMLVLDDGAVVRDGDPRDVITAALVREVFGPGLNVIAHDGRPFVLPAAETSAERVTRVV